MKISQKCTYALKVILDLSNHYQTNLVHINDLAERQSIPPKYLEQILLQLKKGGIIQSKKGPNGGYSLSRHPKDITVGEVIRFIDKAFFSESNAEKLGSPGHHGLTREGFFGVFKAVEEAVSLVIDQIDFSEIQRREAEILARENDAITYYI